MSSEHDDPPIVPQPPPGASWEADERFPTGPWEGFWLQPVLDKKRHWMELLLTFRDGVLRGEGRDRIGRFLIKGRYELENGICYFSKRYLGRHDVYYKGYNEGHGIWGTWELKDPPWRGGFHIWPVGMGDPTQRRLAVEADAPTEPELDPVPVGAAEGEGESTYDQGLGI